MTHISPRFEEQASLFRVSVIERHWTDVRRYLMRRLNCAQDAEDLAQEVCLRFLRLDDEKCPHKPLAYLYGIATHVLADFRTANARERKYLMIDSEAVEDWSKQPGSAVEIDLADTLALQQQLNRALSRLPETHAAVLLAHKHEGLSCVEVARTLGISIHTVEKYITQAKSQLRQICREVRPAVRRNLRRQTPGATHNSQLTTRR